MNDGSKEEGKKRLGSQRGLHFESGELFSCAQWVTQKSEGTRQIQRQQHSKRESLMEYFQQCANWVQCTRRGPEKSKFLATFWELWDFSAGP